MLFNSGIFIFLFLPVLLLIHAWLKPGGRNTFLMGMSLLFYTWGGGYKSFFLILLSIAINFFAGLLIQQMEDKPGLRKLALAAGVIANIALLFYFKYLNFLLSSLLAVFPRSGIKPLEILLPIGISFFTFQGMSYIIDLYRHKVEVQRSLRDLTLYVSLFPQLIAGPIVRYSDVCRQIGSRSIGYGDICYGLKRFIVGLSKKVLIADFLAQRVDMIFDLPVAQISQRMAWLAILCYSFQIFFDFSGYSDMAIGLGRCLGFHFLENFNYPYISRSVTEFWRRWHISLSSWFRDYLYIPLGGNRKGALRTYRNLLLVFLATGIWHGANWTFVVWGLFHGAFLVLERVTGAAKWKGRALAPLQFAVTMLVVCAGWVFFRSKDLSYALLYLRDMFGLYHPAMAGYSVRYFIDARLILTLAAAVVCSLPIAPFLAKKLQGSCRALKNGALLAQNAALVFLLFIDIVFVVSATYTPFIYFRF